MGNLNTYRAYYQAFEDAYDTNIWDKVATYFTAEAMYESPMAGQVQGKENVITVFEESLNRFDKRFSTKRVIDEIETISKDNYLKIVGVVTYPNKGIPNLVVNMTEEVWFKNGLIEKIVDDIPLSERIKIQLYLEQYNNELQ